MDEAMNNIVMSGSTPENSINRELLERYTNKVSEPLLKKVRWSKIEHLYILGKPLGVQSVSCEETLSPGAYVDSSRKWALIFGAEDSEIQRYLSRCTDKLEKLMIRFTGITELSLRGLTGLRTLMLENNDRLCQIWRLEQLSELRKLHLSRTAIKYIGLSERLPHLATFAAKHTPLEQVDFLINLPGLRVALLSDSRFRELPQLAELSRLNVLTVSDSDLSTLEGIVFPPNLASLSLDGTRITQLPDSVGRLRKLKSLDLSRLELEELPLWLPDLGLEFTRSDGDGIRLKGTKIKHVDMSIFDQPRVMVEQWFQLKRQEHQQDVFRDIPEITKKDGGESIEDILKRLEYLDWVVRNHRDIKNGTPSEYKAKHSLSSEYLWMDDLRKRFLDYDPESTEERKKFICFADPPGEYPPVFTSSRCLTEQRRSTIIDGGEANWEKIPNDIISLPDIKEMIKNHFDGYRQNVGGGRNPEELALTYVFDHAEYERKRKQFLATRDLDVKLFEWNCERYVPIGGFINEDWDPSEYRRAFDSRTPMYYIKRVESPDMPDPEEIAKPLNELKVVFLGDGEAGKSHTIARLLHDGDQTDDFPGVSTPGIVIQDKTYSISGRDIKVHFWDFGGQEILHSMHRMFLTEKTLYVVVLNVREGNQQERARYWLYNLRSFASGAPVLLVLNKMDMNKNASVNESDLRTMYPGLTEIVKMSAKNDSRESFKGNFLAALLRQIGTFEYLESPFLPAWSRLKEELQTMKTSYIRGNQFRSLSDKCGVKGSDEVRTGLLEWFSNLGVSFCYSGSAKLEDYVVLRPDWITNAIYILLFNKIEEIKNGLVTHVMIHRMLCSEDLENVQRTMPDAVYREDEVEFVLNVVRKFRLSFQVEAGVEFLPMLCDANSTAAAEEYANDLGALEFRMNYEYLPNNVLHRLMVERSRELDLSNVWLTGARFVYDNTGLSAVVKIEGNLLRMLVRSEDGRDMPQRYLDVLKTDLERINESMGLTVSGTEVAYKQGGMVECFDYEDLLLAQELGDTTIRSKQQKKRIPLAAILMQSDYPVDERRRKLIADLGRACEMLQDNKLYWNQKEDTRTTYLRDLLTAKGYIVMDQHRTGESETQINAGELDLDIRLKPDAHWAALEALNIHGRSKSEITNWDKHLKKLLDNYNAVGRSFLIHMGYVECDKDEFGDICGDFQGHLREFSPLGFVAQRWLTRQILPEQIHGEQGCFLHAIRSVYDCGGAFMTVYHFFVRVGG